MQYKHILEMTAVCALLAKSGNYPATVSVRLGDDFLMTDPAKHPQEIREEDIFKVTADKAAEGITLMHSKLYAARKDINSIITYTSPYTKTAADVLDNLPAVLNDMARLVGHSVRTAADYTPAAVIKAIKRLNGCLVKEQGAVL
ncbi:MAG: class II aldolase/adducin family protein, partial [Clostridia bacterium]